MAGTPFNTTTLSAVDTAGNKLTADWNAVGNSVRNLTSAQAQILTNDVIAYYNTQTGVRTYATEAAEVASDTSLNEQIANNNIEAMPCSCNHVSPVKTSTKLHKPIDSFEELK